MAEGLYTSYFIQVRRAMAEGLGDLRRTTLHLVEEFIAWRAGRTVLILKLYLQNYKLLLHLVEEFSASRTGTATVL